VEPQTAKQAAAAAKKARQVNAAKRATSFFGVLTTELAFNKGDKRGALKAYRILFDRTQDPAVAERAMEIAVGLQDFQQAEQIYQAWQKNSQAAETPEFRRMSWLRHMMIGEYAQAGEHFAEVLQFADDRQRAAMFSIVLKTVTGQEKALSALAKTVHKEAKRYVNLPEAATADAVVSALLGNNKDAVAALHRFTGLDIDLNEQIMLKLFLLSNRFADVRSRFLEEMDANTVKAEWLAFKIDYLLEQRRDKEIYPLLQKLLNEQPSDYYLYVLERVAERLGKSSEEVEAYYERAYQMLADDERSELALQRARGWFEKGKYPQARYWADKIVDKQYAFDKAVVNLMALVGSNEWAAAEEALASIKKLDKKEGVVVDERNLYRTEMILIRAENNPQVQQARLDKFEQSLPESMRQDFRTELIYARAMMYADRLNQPEKAVADLRVLLAEDPNNPTLQNSLGYTLLDVPNADLQEALILVKKAYAQLPDNGAVNDSVGWAYFRLGDAESALPYLEFAWKKDQEAEIAAHLGEVLLNLGRADEAQKVFEAGNLLKNSGRRVFDETVKRLGIVLPKP
ncbi:MAG: hypothetical protein Q4D82_04255, partial [Neisseria sp.]|nr:hypothetical protein [Neisseria sp.]